MGITANGNSLTITGATITFNNAFDPTTGMATITITPSGGLGTLPGLLDGVPGPPPNLVLGTITTLSAGSNATATLTLLSPGGPGTPSNYQLNLGIPAGAAGSTGAFNIHSAADLLGTLQNKFTVLWNTATGQFNPAPLPVATTYYATSINSTSGTGSGPRTLSSIAIPAQSYDWFPDPSSSCVVTGTVNTQINLQAFIGSTSGNQVGVGFGVAGVPTQTVSLHKGVPPGSATTYGIVLAGNSATILLAATQVGATTDAWSTSSTTTSFQVTATPVTT
jgi:hypothetical protein